MHAGGVGVVAHGAHGVLQVGGWVGGYMVGVGVSDVVCVCVGGVDVEM